MNTIQSMFEQAQLAEAAYANLWDSGTQSTITDSDKVRAALIDKKFSAAQATDFVNQWSVVDQYTAPDFMLGMGGTGFSATLFKDTQSGQYTFAVRGTEPGFADLAGADIGDIVADGIAMDQVVDMYNYWQSLTHQGSYTAAKLVQQEAETLQLTSLWLATKLPGVGIVAQQAYDGYLTSLKAGGAIIDTTLLGPTVQHITRGDSSVLLSGTALEYGSGKLTGNPSVDVTGHSLGGHLAAAFTRLFPETGANAVTINGAGFPTGVTQGTSGHALSNIQTLFSELGGASSFDSSRIQNVHGDGPNMVTMNSQFGLVQPGQPPLEIYIESMNPGTTFGHGSGQMTDSLAMYQLFSTIDPSLNTANLADGIGKITDILKASASTATDSLENSLDALRTLFEQNYADNNSSDGRGTVCLSSRVSPRQARYFLVATRKYPKKRPRFPGPKGCPRSEPSARPVSQTRDEAAQTARPDSPGLTALRSAAQKGSESGPYADFSGVLGAANGESFNASESQAA